MTRPRTDLEKVKRRAAYAANAELERERQKAYRDANRERFRQQDRERYRILSATNPEKYREQSRKQRATNPEGVREAAAAWWRRNSERELEKKRIARATPEGRKKRLEEQNRRRARLYEAGYEPVDRDAVIARDKQRCHICGKRVALSDVHLDHLIPLSLGGPHTAANLAVAHSSCNMRKQTKASNEQLRLVG